MRLILLLTACSLIAGCGVPRPDTDLCVINAPAKHLKCYNLKNDYTQDGKLKADAKPTFKPFEELSDVNKFIATDPDGFSNLKAYVQKLRQANSACEARKK